MEFPRRQLLHIVATAVTPPALSCIATAQTDRRPVRLLVGFASGSSVDIIGRLMAEQINKAQGLTMDAAYLDIRAAREPGQAYVAVSRVRTLAGLHFKDWFKGVWVSEEAIRFYEGN